MSTDEDSSDYDQLEQVKLKKTDCKLYYFASNMIFTRIKMDKLLSSSKVIVSW